MFARQKKPQSPYVGPEPFDRKDKEYFYGRRKEAATLLNLLIADRIVLLHSPSGAGKTSLIKAALIDALEEKGFHVLPVIRIGMEITSSSATSFNRYVASTLLSLTGSKSKGTHVDSALFLPNELMDMTLAAYLDQPADIGQEAQRRQVLIFDQFEEILTADPTDFEEKIAFFKQLGTVLYNEKRRALFAIREDFMGVLQTYVEYIPTRLEATFRLGLLDKTAAREAIQEPARNFEGKKVDFDSSAVERLIKELCQVNVQEPNGFIHTKEGQYIEPVYLQVVCQRLWEKSANNSTITASDIEGDQSGTMNHVDSALADYYAQRVRRVVLKRKEIAKKEKVRERIIREWFGMYLINELTYDGGKTFIRGQVCQGFKVSQGLSNTAINALIDAHLVRAERRNGISWFELAHDRLINPVQINNESWFKENLESFQRQASIWKSQGQLEGLLLNDDNLLKAQQWKKTKKNKDELTPTDQEFLDASEDALSAVEQERYKQQIQAAQEKIKLNRARIRAYRFAICIIAFTSILGYVKIKGALNNEKSANRKFTAILLGTQAILVGKDRRDLGLLLAYHAYNYISKTPEVRSNLLTVLGYNPQIHTYLHGHKNLVYSLAFSPDGKTLASADYGGVALVWNLRNNSPQQLPSVKQDAIECLAFSPNGKILASGSDDGRIVLWSKNTHNQWSILNTSNQSAGLNANSGKVSSISFKSNDTLVAGYQQGNIILWDIKTGKERFRVSHSHDDIVSIALSKDGKTLAAGSKDHQIALWDISNTSKKPRLFNLLKEHDDEVYFVTFSPDGHTLASADKSGEIIVWDVSKLRPRWKVQGHTDTIWSLAFSPDSKILASCSEDQTIRLWAVDTSDPIGIPLTGHGQEVNSVVFSPDGKTLVSASDSKDIILWDMSKLNWLVGQEGSVQSIAASPDGQTLATGGKHGDVLLWDIPQCRLRSRRKLTGAREIYSLAFSPDNKTLAAACASEPVKNSQKNGKLILWNYRTGTVKWKQSTDEIHSVAFNPDGKLLALGFTTRDNGTTDVLDAQTGVEKWPSTHTDQIGEVPGEVNCVAFSPDGSLLASAYLDGTIRLWDVQTSKQYRETLEVTKPGLDEIHGVAFSPDGKLLASASFDGTVRLWDVRTCKLYGEPLIGHTSVVESVAFSPDGKRLISCGRDSTVILWDITGPIPFGLPLKAHRSPVNQVTIIPHSTAFASCSDDGMSILWHVSLEDWPSLPEQIAHRNMNCTEWKSYLRHEPYSKTFGDLPDGCEIPTH